MSKAGDLLGADGRVAARLPGYEIRPQQLELAEAIEDALAARTHLLAEAGTGVGKSFAYLLPAVLHALEHAGEGPVVVSTRTIGLQEQLDHKDLPFLKSVLPLEWSAVTAVGRSHYLCLRRMHLAHQEQQGLFPDAARRAELQRIVDWSHGQHDHTRQDLEVPVTDEVWAEVRAEHGNCLGKLCKHYEPCGWQRGKRRMQNASLLIVNHALYMADVALRMAGAAYLPAHSVVIFDEAHHLERVATEGLGLRLSHPSVLWHLRRLAPQRGAGGASGLLEAYGSPQAKELHENVRGLSEEFFAWLGTRLSASDKQAVPLGEESLGEPLGAQLCRSLGMLAGELVLCAGRIQQVDRRAEVSARANGLAALAGGLRRLCEPESREQLSDPEAEPGAETAASPRLVRWIERDARTVRLCAAPLDVADALRRHVFHEGRTAVLVSATLAAGRDDREFRWLRRQLGIDRARTLRLGSPFDYARQVRLVLEQSLPDPAADAKRFQDQSRTKIKEHLLQNGGRALVLCTSWSFVRDVAGDLRQALAEAGIRLLVQGEAPLVKLLHDKLADPTSVLVGTDSLWEGIDLPGEALTLVIIARFPFAQPGHPLTDARLAAIAARGGDAFLEHSLPEAIVKFRQGFGRLIRRGSDAGTVVILDPRASTRPYGRRFLEALPEGVLQSRDS